ncbi:D-xylose transport system substrate-binding protein [Evansella vedderi]|uniref:D-xylose transport system substrate-binding protein n=1 Tax=Evansella vedderi TaxID=38282 RepID=A0ABT9ZPV5_9BACI|nr:D-xylose ABC transporter substrate-binding protein [Evansella vedderi]MDQ0253274.1 D-xylose transport system substrate-binding protein [Evansella vedderi]
MKKWILSLLLVFGLIVFTACGEDAASNGDSGDGESSLRIGLSVADLTLERWQHDRDIFVETAESLGAEVIVQSADGDETVQANQVENMLTQGIDVLVIIAHNSDSIGSVAAQAQAEGIPVIAYDRMINNAEIEAYISFDNVRVGEMQAEYLVEQVPTGNYFLMGGAPTDNNAHMFRQGQMNILEPLIESGDITIVGDQWADGWSADAALGIMENALTATNNEIDVVVASNDSTAGGAIEALAAQGLAGEVKISGQDADLAAVQRIVEGTQSMTVYKQIHLIASQAAELAVKIANGEEIEFDDRISNGTIEVPSILLTPISVNADNVIETVIEDGFHSFEDVYRNVPEEERPDYDGQ